MQFDYGFTVRKQAIKNRIEIESIDFLESIYRNRKIAAFQNRSNSTID